jgi:peptide chain release factor 3
MRSIFAGLVLAGLSSSNAFAVTGRRQFDRAITVPSVAEEKAAGARNSEFAAPPEEIVKRRNLAIIAHPDAGKTTLTEKLLLYGGALQQAGAVRTRADQRAATSDWMELEQQRGISITSTVLSFEYAEQKVILLDTPGHQDFSEDTYRTLAACDNAVCLVDAAKGLEPQTRKLLEVCRLSGLPIFTFCNKMDRPALDPLELIDQIETEFGLTCHPMVWPIGDGPEFQGVLDREDNTVHLFERGDRRGKAKDLEVVALDDPLLPELIGERLYEKLVEDAEVLDGLVEPLDMDRVRKGDQSPMFFGSAMNNFGVELF